YIAIIILYSWLFRNVTSEPFLWRYTLPQLIFLTFYTFYDLVAEIFFNGQSIGKYIMKIKVVSLDGGRPRLGQYIIRYIFRAVDFVLTLGIGAIISVALTEQKQRIGDIVAGTTLVRTKTKMALDDLDYVETEDDYEPVFEQVALLTDQDIALINEVMKNFNKTGNTVLVDNMGIRIKKHLGVQLPEKMGMYAFLTTVLKDYNHLTTRV
ncbi:MAG: RDD family protein, partial [Mucilaginibacter sp.]